jgi:hypothetical protein
MRARDDVTKKVKKKPQEVQQETETTPLQMTEEMTNVLGPNEVFANKETVTPITENEGAAETNNSTPPAPVQPTRQLKRTWKPTRKIIERIQQEEMDVNLTAKMYVEDLRQCASVYMDEKCAEMYRDDDQSFIDEMDPLAIMAQLDKDTMYWHEAMKQHDAAQFWEAVVKEITTHHKNKHW